MWGAKFAAYLMRKMGRWPQPVRHYLARFLTFVAYPLLKRRRRVASINLKKCFPDWSDAQIEQTVRTHVGYFVHALIDRSLFWFGDLKAFERNIEMVDAHYFTQALAHNRPLIVLAPHFVGLDIGGLRMNFEREMGGMYQKQPNPVFEDLIREGRSRAKRTHLFTRQDGVRSLIKLLRQKIVMYYLPDMDFGRKDSIFVPFFGVPAATLTALPKLAAMTDALIVPCVTRIDPDALARGETLYKAQFYPAWDGYPEGDEHAAVLQMNAFIEARILEEPAQYLWLHKRFKTRPDGEASFYKKG
ncbi:MAG: lysophospholipid acyltransferase family protein [Formosimonas sp.]